MTTTRPVTIVLGYETGFVSPDIDDVRDARLTGTVAVVFSTYREGNPDMVLDHPLWVACARAVSEVVRADESDVFIDATPTSLEELLHRDHSNAPGSFDSYAEILLRNPDAPLWQQVRWRQKGRLVAAATHEPWWRVGGPDLYHDSYTSCFFVAPSAVQDVVAAIRAAVEAEGISVDQVLKLQARGAA